MRILILLLFTQLAIGQKNIDEVVQKYNKEVVPYIQIKDFKVLKNPVILDTREQSEYDVSHLKDAVCVGFDHFKLEKINKKFTNKNDTIVVYCSLSVRSEIIGVKLKKAGYKNVYNLYGGIFYWKNNNEPIYDNANKITEKIHAYSKEWGKYLTKGKNIY